eukprot:PhF_6_TR10857/c0_g1_i1/m.17582
MGLILFFLFSCSILLVNSQPPYITTNTNEQKLIILGYQATQDTLNQVAAFYNRTDYYFVVNISASDAQRNCTHIINLEKSGIQVLISIPTSFGRRALVDVLSDIITWKATTSNQSCPVDGFFIDEVSSDSVYLNYYLNISSRIRSSPNPPARPNTTYPIVFDVGRNVTEGLMAACDTVVLFDGPLAEFGWWSWTPPTWSSKYAWSRFAVIVHNVPNVTAMTTVVEITRKYGVQYIYVTNDSAPYPYDTLPPYMSTMMTNLARNTTWLRRGLFVDINTPTFAGQRMFSSNTSWMKYEFILQNTTDIDELVSYVRRGGYNAVSLNGMGMVLANTTLTNLVQPLLRRLRSEGGVDLVELVGTTLTTEFWQNVTKYQTAQGSFSDGSFDGFVLNVSGVTSANVLTVTQQLSGTSCRVPLKQCLFHVVVPASVSFSSTEVASMGQSGVTSFMIQSYVRSPDLAFAALRDFSLVSLGAGVFVVAMFSTEGTEISRGVGTFMGDWCISQRSQNISPSGILSTAETVLSNTFLNAYPQAQGHLSGFQWFDYFTTSVMCGAVQPSTTTQSPTVAPTSTPSPTPSSNTSTPVPTSSQNGTVAPTSAPNGTTASPTPLPPPSNATTIPPSTTSSPSSNTTLAPTSAPSNATTIPPTTSSAPPPSSNTTASPTNTTTSSPVPSGNTTNTPAPTTPGGNVTSSPSSPPSSTSTTTPVPTGGGGNQTASPSNDTNSSTSPSNTTAPITAAPTPAPTPAPPTPAPSVPFCSISMHCNNRASTVVISSQTNKCLCSCKNNWKGNSCEICPSPYLGTECNKCADGYILPKCRACDAKTDCNDHANDVFTNRDQTGCLCSCRNQWTGGKCDQCNSTKYGGTDCDRCAAGLINYPSCLPPNYDPADEKAACKARCAQASCTSSELVKVTQGYLCSCAFCTAVSSRVCGTLWNGTKVQCFSPQYKCMVLNGRNQCVVKNVTESGVIKNVLLSCSSC